MRTTQFFVIPSVFVQNIIRIITKPVKPYIMKGNILRIIASLLLHRVPNIFHPLGVQYTIRISSTGNNFVKQLCW